MRTWQNCITLFPFRGPWTSSTGSMLKSVTIPSVSVSLFTITLHSAFNPFDVLPVMVAVPTLCGVIVSCNVAERLSDEIAAAVQLVNSATLSSALVHVIASASFWMSWRVAVPLSDNVSVPKAVHGWFTTASTAGSILKSVIDAGGSTVVSFEKLKAPIPKYE